MAARRKGLAIIASEPREFAIVNIVGSIDLEKLHELEGKFGVPELEIETGKKTPEKARAEEQPKKVDATSTPRLPPESLVISPKTPSANTSTVTPSATSSKTYCAWPRCCAGTSLRTQDHQDLHRRAGHEHPCERTLRLPDEPAIGDDERRDDDAAHP